jgi:hypothetical protein
MANCVSGFEGFPAGISVWIGLIGAMLLGSLLDASAGRAMPMLRPAPLRSRYRASGDRDGVLRGGVYRTAVPGYGRSRARVLLF